MTVGPYIAGLIQIRPQYHDVSASIHENVTWWQSADPTPKTLVEMQNIRDTFDAAWSAIWPQVGSSGAHYIGCVATDFTSNTGEQALNTSFTPVAGGEGAGLPNQVSILASLHVAQRYKGGHGRLYFPCIGGQTLGADIDHADPSKTGPVQTALDLMTNSGISSPNVSTGTVTAGSGLLWCILRHRASGTPTLPAVVGCTVQTLWATQRRRLRKAAHH